MFLDGHNVLFFWRDNTIILLKWRVEAVGVWSTRDNKQRKCIYTFKNVHD